MASFVLVHGSGQNAGSWAAVARLLTARGHAVSAPDLPKQAPDWHLQDYAAAIARAAPAPGAVVVAHSFSGVFLPLVPRSSDVARLVFLAAVIPEPGKSVRQQLAEDPSMFDPGWLAAGARWFDKAQARDLAREFLFQDVRGESLAEALDTLEMLDTRQLAVEPCPLEAWPDVPAVSVVAADDRTLSPAWGRRMTRQLLGCEPIEIEGGHCPQTSRPEELAELLEQLATGALSAPPR